MRSWDLIRYALTSCVAAALLAGCGSGQPPIASTMSQSRALTKAQHNKIKHVVIIVQIGRSFNNLFEGAPGSRTVRYGYDSKNRKIMLKPVSLGTTWQLEANAYAACNGTGSIPSTDCRMNGFNKERWTCDKPGNPPCPIKYPPYAYVPHTEIKP